MSIEYPLLPCDGCCSFGPVSRRPRRTYMHPWARLAHINDAMADLQQQIEFLDRSMKRVALDQKKLHSFHPGVETHVEGGRYHAKIPLGAHIKPDDLKISLSAKDRLLTIQAKREEKSKDGNSRVYQEFTRKFTFPEKVEVKEAKAVLTPEGCMEIDAPLPALTGEEKKELETGMTPEGFVDVAEERNLKGDSPDEGVEIPVTVASETKPTGIVPSLPVGVLVFTASVLPLLILMIVIFANYSSSKSMPK